jgi:uncharacterized membrane protein
LILANILIIADVPFLREVVSIIVFFTVPGILILSCLNLPHKNKWEYLVYSIGLSVSFLMIIGLLANIILPAVGILRPLEEFKLLAIFDLILLILWVFAYTRKNGDYHEEIPNSEGISLKNKIFTLIPFLFPILAAIGAYHMNINPQSIIPMIVLAFIALYVLILTISNKDGNISKDTFAIAILMIAISLIFMISLRSEHLFGCDVNGEYFVSQLTKDSMQWKPSSYAYSTSLSVSMLPGIISSLSGITEEFFFKVIAQILFALVPLIIFLFLSRYTKPIYAFLSAFFFLSIELFYLFLIIVRSEIAFFFLALSLLIVLDSETKITLKKILFVVFSASLVLSHYTVSYIYLGMIFVVAISNLHKKEENRTETVVLTTAFLFFAFIFLWYGQVISSPFNGLISIIENMVHNLANLLSMEARSAVALSSLSLPAGQLLVKLSRYTSLLMKIFIIIGTVYLIINSGKLNIRKKFVVIAAYSLMFVVLSIFLPVITKEIDIERIFLQSLMILCFCCMLGIKTTFEKVRIKEKTVQILIVILFLIFFLFQSGFIFNLFNMPSSPSLNNDALAYRMWNIPDKEVISAEWLSVQNPERVYGDFNALLRLWGYGRIIPIYVTSGEIPRGYLLTENSTLANSYVYLRYDNALHNSFLIKDKGNYIYIENVNSILKNKNKVYDNGVWIYR